MTLRKIVRLKRKRPPIGIAVPGGLFETSNQKGSAMNISTNLSEINSTATSMSSREIAELCDKVHHNVLRDIEKMISDIGLDALTFEAIYSDAMNREKKEYRLPKDLTVTLITGYRADLRYKVIKRLEELEVKPTAIDFNSPQVVLGVITGLQDNLKAAEAQIIEFKPKAEGYDQLINADGLYGLQNAARALAARPNLFIRWLKQTFLFYQGNALVARVQYTQRGLFEVRTTIVDDKVRPTVFITPKGLDYFRDKIPGELLIGGVA